VPRPRLSARRAAPFTIKSLSWKTGSLTSKKGQIVGGRIFIVIYP
jgi:hypothetical protein